AQRSGFSKLVRSNDPCDGVAEADQFVAGTRFLGMASRKAEIERSPQRPKALVVHPEAIPSALRELSQWVCWRFEWRQKKLGEGKWTKVPINPKSGRRASTTDLTTWSSFPPALVFYQSHRTCIDGIGFVFAADDPFFGVDLDDARDRETGELEPSA